MSEPLSTSALASARLAAAQFGRGPIGSVVSYGSGHIHDTYLVEGTDGERWILQRFNERVFPEIDAVMGNIVRVTDHARATLRRRGASTRVLTVRRSRAGAAYVRDAQGSAYRAFEFIAGATSAGHQLSARVAFEAGRAFGEFADLLRDLPDPPLVTTIPGFHDTPGRLSALRAALQRDPVGRARAVQAEWTEIEQRTEVIAACHGLAERGALPLRIAHNDAKLDNVLLEAETLRALCVVDLDTVMPGYLAHDFGDLVRTTACLAEEDTTDLARVVLRQEYFEALARGYLQVAGDWLQPEERESLPFGALWISVELAIRFLTDYLLGDSYFKVDRPEHNLERARVQLQLLRVYDRERAAWLGAWQRLVATR